MLDFNYIKKYEPISVVGHINGDCDSFISCVLMSKYLDFKGIANKKKLLDNVFDSNAEILGIKKDDFELGLSVDEAVFMVDSSLSLPNIIVGCIDHHKSESNTDINYINKKSTSCAKIIYDIMLADGYIFSAEEVKMVVFSLFMDSCSFKSTKALKEDHEWAKKIIKEYNLNYDEFYQKGLLLNDIFSNFDELCFHGMKSHSKNNKTYYSSYIQVKEDTSEDFDKNCIETIRKYMDREDIILWVFLIHNIYEEKTKYMIIEPFRAIIHEEDRLLSRGNDVIPMIEHELFTMSSYFEKYSNYNYSFIVNELISKELSISTMESCTSGLIASKITDTENASRIFKGAFVTYSNESKILQGVKKETIDKYGVYSYETSLGMAKACSNAYNSLIGIGVTGTTGNIDINNLDSSEGEIYFTIKFKDKFYSSKILIDVIDLSRNRIKEEIIYIIFSSLGKLIYFYS